MTRSDTRPDVIVLMTDQERAAPPYETAELTAWRNDHLAGARWLISNHGAALTNMIAMPPGALVLEMRQREGATPNCFLTLASALGLGFHYQMVDAVDPRKSVYRGDMRVDPQAFAHTLADMPRSSSVCQPIWSSPCRYRFISTKLPRVRCSARSS